MTFADEPKTPSLSYLAAPYRHDDPNILRFRLLAVTYTAYEMINRGSMVFSPLTHNLPIDRVGFHGDWTKWGPFDRLLLSRCDRLLVLTLPGWEESAGVACEIRWAEELGIPMEKIKPTPEAMKLAHEESLKASSDLREALLRNIRKHPSRYPETLIESFQAFKHTSRSLDDILDPLSNDSVDELKRKTGELMLKLFHLAEQLKFDPMEEGRRCLIRPDK